MKKTIWNLVGLVVIGAMALTACGGGAAAKDFSKVTSAADGGGMDALVAAAKAEGQLTVIALPHDWCNYGEVIEGFKAKYGLTVALVHK